jgi:hypothetical protein
VEYLVWTGPTQPKQEAGWRWCERCWSLFWANNEPTAGARPRGGKHRPFLNSEISVDFT